MVININNGDIVASVSAIEGVAVMDVINGGWEGKIDWAEMEFWPEAYPERKTAITNFKIAVKGEHQYY